MSAPTASTTGPDLSPKQPNTTRPGGNASLTSYPERVGAALQPAAGYLGVTGRTCPPRTEYQVRLDAWRAALTLTQHHAAERRVLIEEGLALLEQATPQRRQRLMSMHQVFAFVEAHYLSAAQPPGHRGLPPNLTPAPAASRQAHQLPASQRGG